MAVYASVGLLLLVTFLGITFLAERVKREQFFIPDENAVAAARLSQSFTSPRYFAIQPREVMNETGIAVPAPVAETQAHISPTAAHRQVDRIVKERNLAPQATAKLHALIDRLTEEPKSRAVGKTHVHLLRLNLALDCL